MSQSPEGSIYMECIDVTGIKTDPIFCLSRPKAQSTWNKREHQGPNRDGCSVSVARRLNLHGINVKYVVTATNGSLSRPKAQSTWN